MSSYLQIVNAVPEKEEEQPISCFDQVFCFICVLCKKCFQKKKEEQGQFQKKYKSLKKRLLTRSDISEANSSSYQDTDISLISVERRYDLHSLISQTPANFEPQNIDNLQARKENGFTLRKSIETIENLSDFQQESGLEQLELIKLYSLSSIECQQSEISSENICKQQQRTQSENNANDQFKHQVPIFNCRDKKRKFLHKRANKSLRNQSKQTTALEALSKKNCFTQKRKKLQPQKYKQNKIQEKNQQDFLKTNSIQSIKYQSFKQNKKFSQLLTNCGIACKQYNNSLIYTLTIIVLQYAITIRVDIQFLQYKKYQTVAKLIRKFRYSAKFVIRGQYVEQLQKCSKRLCNQLELLNCPASLKLSFQNIKVGSQSHILKINNNNEQRIQSNSFEQIETNPLFTQTAENNLHKIESKIERPDNQQLQLSLAQLKLLLESEQSESVQTSEQKENFSAEFQTCNSQQSSNEQKQAVNQLPQFQKFNSIYQEYIQKFQSKNIKQIRQNDKTNQDEEELNSGIKRYNDQNNDQCRIYFDQDDIIKEQC